MSRLSRSSDSAMPFPSLITAVDSVVNVEDKKYTPSPPQKGKHHAKKHPHPNDFRIQLEPLRPPTAESNDSNGNSRKPLVNTAEGVPKIEDFVCSDGARLLESKRRFYKKLASIKLRDVADDQKKLFPAVDTVLMAMANVLPADFVSLYSVNKHSEMLQVVASTAPSIVGFQVPILIDMDMDSDQFTYLGNLQACPKYDASLDVDCKSGLPPTCTIFAGSIADATGKSVFLLEARSSQENVHFSQSIFTAARAAVDNLVYAFDLAQEAKYSTKRYDSINAYLEQSIAYPRTGADEIKKKQPQDSDAFIDLSEKHETDDDQDVISKRGLAAIPSCSSLKLISALMNDESAKIALRDQDSWLMTPNLNSLVQTLQLRTQSDAVILLGIHPFQKRCHTIVNVNAGKSWSSRLTESETLAALTLALSPDDQHLQDDDKDVTPSNELFDQIVECVAVGTNTIDLSANSTLRSIMQGADDLLLKFMPLPQAATGFTRGGLLFMTVQSSVDDSEQHVAHQPDRFDLVELQPFLATLVLAMCATKQGEAVKTSMLQTEKLINIFNAHFQVETINDPSALVNFICAIGSDLFNTPRVTLYVADPIKRELWSLSTLSSVNGLRIPYGTGIAGTVARTKTALVVRNPYADPRFDRSVDTKSGFKTESLITFPVLDKNGETMGVIQAVNSMAFMDPLANPLILRADEKVLLAYSQFVSNALRVNSSLIMFAKVQADYWANRGNLIQSDAVEEDNSNGNGHHEVASVHSLLDTSGFDDAKRVPRNKWSTFAYACWGLGKFLSVVYRLRRLNRQKAAEQQKWHDSDAGSTSDERVRSRSKSVMRVGRASSMINRWRHTMIQDGEELLSDTFDPLAKSVAELKEFSYQFFNGLALVKTFRIKPTVLQCFIDTIAGKYRSVPYHSFYHAFDVAHSCYRLVRKTSVMTVIKEFEALSLLLASLGHDADHPGNDNQFEVDSSSPLALCYNDISVLENHHAATTFSVLKRKCHMFL